MPKRTPKGSGEPKTALAKLIDHFGGGERTAHVAGVRSATIYGWNGKGKGKVPLLRPALNLALAAEDDPARVVALLKQLAFEREP